MSELLTIVVGFAGAAPLFAMAWFWQKRPRGRSRGVGEALAAIVASVLIVMLAGVVFGPLTSGGLIMVPLVIGGLVLALSLNRMVQDA